MSETLSNEKRGLILDAARKRFAYYGFSKVTMDEIAADVGMGKASLYYYFPTKESLYEMMVREEAAQFLSTIEKSMKQGYPASKMFRVYASERMEHFKKLANLRALSFQTATDSKSSLHDLFKEFQQNEIDIIHQILSHGRKSGEFDLQNTRRSAEVVIQMFYGARSWHLKMRHNVLDDETFDAMKNSTREMTEMILNGILKR